MVNKLKSLDKKQKIILLVIFIFIALLAFFLSYAYLAPIIGSNETTNVDVEGKGIESLTFEKGRDISIVATPDNFGVGDDNLDSTTHMVVKARANKSGDPYTASYNLFLNIGSNNYEYSDGSTPELLLTVVDPNGNPVTELDGLTYTTQNGVSGFDITTKKGVIDIAVNYEITSPDYNTIKIHEWDITITLVAHTFSQNVNQNKELVAMLEATKNEVTEYALLELCDGLNMGECLTSVHGDDQGLLHHTPSLANGAGDNNYRYSGSNDVVDENHVCFGSDISPCPEENLYRIIGIYDGSVKLIKATAIDKDGDGVLEITQNGHDTFQWDAGNSNDYETSDIKAYLNGEFYNAIPSSYQSMIKESIWNVGGNNLSSETAYEFYRDNIGTPVVNKTSTGKIGLMYASDYGYAAHTDAWITDLFGYSSQTIKDNNWLFNLNSSEYEWTIVPSSSYSTYVWYVLYNGIVSNFSAYNGYASRPVLYLEVDTSITGGTGTSSDPFTVEYTDPNNFSNYLIANHSEEQGLLQHTADLTNGAGDDNYRYSGSNSVVSNNWVCFGNDETTCPEENKYRIIGIYDGSVKLIKSNAIDKDGDGILEITIHGQDTFQYDAADSNDYETSDIKAYLNGEFYYSIPASYQSMIKDTTWYVGGNNIAFETAYEFYRDNIGSPVINKTSTGKIGLMYASDYGYAAHTDAWTTDFSDYDNQTIKDNNWLFNLNSSEYEWTIVPLSVYSNGVWYVNDDGNVSYSTQVYYGRASRPVLYLESSVKILSGTGSEAEPFRIGM